MTTYIYSRTSTTEQNVEQQSAYLAKKHPHHDFIVSEQFSGVSIERPKFQDLLRKLNSGDVLIVREVSRIGRTTSEVLQVADELKGRSVSLVIDNLGMDITTPAGQMVLTVLAGAAQMEKELLLERQAIGINRAKAEGKYTGRKPLDNNLIDTAKQLISSGMSKAAVARQLKIGESTLYKYISKK